MSTTSYKSERNNTSNINRFNTTLKIVVASILNTLYNDKLSTKTRQLKVIRTQLNIEISFTIFVFKQQLITINQLLIKSTIVLKI